MADNVTFDLYYKREAVPQMPMVVSGHSLSQSSTATITMVTTVSGTGLEGVIGNRTVTTDTSAAIELTMEVSGDAAANLNKKNWLAWSKIGNVSFELDKVNDSGQRPMDWKGYVYDVRQLGNGAIVYGSGGVTLAYPVDAPMATFGFKNLSKVGVMNKDAVAGNDQVHFFLDKVGELHQVTQEGIKRVGYKEFLGELTNPVLRFDEVEQKLYISDASEGYIYNEGALGGGYGNLADIGYIEGSFYALTCGSISAPDMEIITDVMDFGSRGRKDIESLVVSADRTDVLEVAIDYKYSESGSFTTTSWIRLNQEGFARIKCSAVEFRLRVRNTARKATDIHYMNINIKHADKRFVRGYEQ